MELKIKPIGQTEKYRFERLTEHEFLFHSDNNFYYITSRRLSYKVKDFKLNKINGNRFAIKCINKSALLNPLLRTHMQYGTNDSFLADMQGINSFLYGRAKIFQDKTIREILFELQYLKPHTRYLRFGAAGARPRDGHPGGEVVELSFIDGSNGGGISKTQSGYLPKHSIFSQRIPLYESDHQTLRDERTIYSHTAFLPFKNDNTKSNNICFSINAKTNDSINVLEVVDSVVKGYGLKAYGIQVAVSASKKSTVFPLIIGRVLKHLPNTKIKTLQMAKNIASEQTFSLRPKQQALLFGTYFKRVEKDWEKFRKGRPYEPHGHIHALIIGGKQLDYQHNLFHLRSLSVSLGNKCDVIITPIWQIVQIKPVLNKKGRIIDKASLKTIVSYKKNG